MICKNIHCRSKNFCAVIEPDNNTIIGFKCLSCSARYLIEEVEIKNNIKREGMWNSAKWSLKKY